MCNVEAETGMDSLYLSNPTTNHPPQVLDQLAVMPNIAELRLNSQVRHPPTLHPYGQSYTPT